jgi:hypothetical protein
MKGDANEFMKKLKGSLLAEVKAQCCKDKDYDNDLIKSSFTNYLDIFDSGLTEKSIQCSVCKKITTKETPFEELILCFDQSHHDDNNKNKSCTLGELLISNFCPTITTLSANVKHAMRRRK